MRSSDSQRTGSPLRIVAFTIVPDGDGGFRDADTNADCHELVARYSRFKFGDPVQVRWFGRELAHRAIGQLRHSGPFRQQMEQIASERAYAYLIAPGVRNVVSSSNQLAECFAEHVNVALSQFGLPTLIIRRLARLSSGRADYSRLSAAERDGRAKTTKSLAPRSDYQEYPIHVFFLDDVEVSGSTADRARLDSLEAGARSFHRILALQVPSHVGKATPEIEDQLNRFVVTGALDSTVAEIVNHPEFRPVQRVLRLLLHPDNRAQLGEFSSQLSDQALLALYTSAVGNDYLWIQDERGLQPYHPSLRVLQRTLAARRLVDEEGLLTHSAPVG